MRAGKRLVRQRPKVWVKEGRGKREKGEEGGGVCVCVCVCYLDQSPPKILLALNSLAQLREL